MSSRDVFVGFSAPCPQHLVLITASEPRHLVLIMALPAGGQEPSGSSAFPGLLGASLQRCLWYPSGCPWSPGLCLCRVRNVPAAGRGIAPFDAVKGTALAGGLWIVS